MGSLAFVDQRSAHVSVSQSEAFAPIRQIGGKNGWYYADFLWQLRGLLDRCVGGPGTRRGRTDQDRLRVGDVIDFWRVEAFVPDRLLRLQAELRMPGRGCLEFEVSPNSAGSIIRQKASYDGGGLFGKVYWYFLYPVHSLIFRGLIAELARRAENR